MITIADIARQYRHELASRYAKQMLPGHYRALDAIINCRTGGSGEAQWQCQQCDKSIRTPLSCGHRNCPRCQNYESSEWLERQRDKLLPVNYFLLTFTLPAQLRNTAWHHQRLVFDLMFKAVTDTIRQFTANRLKGDPGMTLILHTHSRQMDFHPHIHVVMPGGAFDPISRHWKKLSGQYLFNAFNLATVFRAKCLQAFNTLGISLPAKLPDKWVAHCKYAGSGEPALKYLSRYLYRGVISEQAITSNIDGNITFHYKDSTTKAITPRNMPGVEFLWKLLCHVLPRGFQRVRHYGFLHHNARRLLLLIQLKLRVVIKPRTDEPKSIPVFTCTCGSCDFKLVAVYKGTIRLFATARASPQIAL